MRKTCKVEYYYIDPKTGEFRFKHDPFDFHYTYRSIFDKHDIEYPTERDFKAFWQGGLMAFAIWFLPILLLTKFSINTLYVLSAIVITLSTLMDISMRMVYWSPILAINGMTIAWLVCKWISTPSTLSGGIAFVIAFLIMNYLNKTVALQCNSVDRVAYTWLFCFTALILPNQYLTIGMILLLMYYIIVTPISIYIISPRIKYKLGYPIYVDVWWGFAIVSYVTMKYLL